jgi:uncharacterized protein (DUF1697 family)
VPEYIALLRAVNVGKRQVKMASLREWLTEAGFTDVETYIQTGNVKAGSSLRSVAKVEAALERLLLERAGFEVACIVLTPQQLSQVYADAQAIEPPPFAGDPEERRFVVFFKKPVAAEHVAKLADYDPPTERAWAVGRAVHIWIAGNFHEAKVFNAFKVALNEGTNRNLDVVRTLAERWGR